uniref:hypothetical protein n=1 Tax=Listeria ilorinensis TaxID=2867439 RepID=UPI001EF43063
PELYSLISIIYSLLVTILMFGLMIAPSYQFSIAFRNEGIDNLINFEIQAFHIDGKSSFLNQSTYKKMKVIEKNVMEMSVSDKRLFLAYFESKGAVPFPVLLPVFISTILGIFASCILNYYEKDPLVLLGGVYIIFMLLAGPLVNWIIGTRQRSLTERYVVQIIKNEDTKKSTD